MSDKQFPDNWRISQDFDPQDHMMKLSGRDYLNVQNRLLWFVRDQRDFIVRGLATTSYVIRSELIEHDLQAGYAQFRTYVRDVLGNEATMYGSETAKDFKDYAEKASTKSLGRALAMLGYGTQYAPEMDEGERVVDSPVERPQNAHQRTPQPNPTAQPKHAPASTSGNSQASQSRTASSTPMATEQQRAAIHKLCNSLGKLTPVEPLTYAEARRTIAQLSDEYQRERHTEARDERDLSTLGNGGGRH